MPTSLMRRKAGSLVGITNLAKPSARFVVVLSQTGAIAVRAAFGAWRAPFPCVLETLDIAVQSLGATGGETSVDVNRAIAPGSAAATLLTAPFSLAYDAANAYLTAVPSGGALAVGSGNVISGDVDTICTSGAAGLTLAMVFRSTHVAS